MASGRVYGEIPGYPEGSGWINRAALAAAGVHRPLQGGISGGQDGADSIVVSGGYPDDEDYGDEIVYTGQGGRDPNTGRQISDQELVLGNIGLVRSQLDERPVRVIRGAGGDPNYSPQQGFRYDGLFQVVEHWHAVGQEKFRIWRYRLIKISGQSVLTDAEAQVTKPAPRATYRGARIVRNRTVAERVKRLHDHTCQVCCIRLMTAAGAYAEGAHIKGLGRPHNGPDDESNMLCLCPNHHLLFDAGAIYVDAGGNVWDSTAKEIVGSLHTVPRHKINWEFLQYHRDHFATP
jgi:putative restriction endonuclease